MPRGNGTGPNRMGPTTGRAAGYCAGYGMPGYMNNAGGLGRGRGLGFGMGFGRNLGFGRGFGFGQGFGRWGGWGMGLGQAPYAISSTPWDSVPDAGVERSNLERQAEILSAELKSVQERLEVLEKTKESDA